MKGFVAGCSLVMLTFIIFMIDTRADIAAMKATLVTNDNMATLRDEIREGDKKNHNEIGRYISLVSYIAIEAERSVAVSDLFVSFGRRFLSKDVHIKEEELEKFRTTSIARLNRSVRLGTARGE